MNRYDPKVIEPKWQRVWEETRLYEVTEDHAKQKIYATPMLPYPSGAGLHIGHVRNYSIADTLARFYRQRGYNVMSNIGWDSFGLPAENYAIKTGTPPWETTQTNIKNFKKQLQRLGMSYAWEREIDTSDPSYYRWTQWIFIQLFNAGLAYQAESLQWWCPDCKTVLANEQVVGGCCWRHEDVQVIKKRLMQWFFKITDYADTLLKAIDDLDWPQHIKTMQRNWIGRSEGAEIDFAVVNSPNKITVFTTRPDTLFGATFLVVAPEHELLETVTESEVLEYIRQSVKKSDIDRMDQDREKTGVFSGLYAINPLTKQQIPIWVADYVLAGYGTGAIMAVPAHDERDWAFAKKYDLTITFVFDQDGMDGTGCYAGEGIMKNSGEYDGMTTAEARDKIVADLAKSKQARATTTYKLRDWLISRQRYWGAPIPIIHCPSCNQVAVPEQDLPVMLPKVHDFTPTGTSLSVLAAEDEWVQVQCPKCGGKARRETDTMDGYACSSWYMYRYADPKNQNSAFSLEKVNYWFPVDFYFGGDHAVSHLLYFRFWHRFFVDRQLISQNITEPVKRLVYNGYINAEDGRKMSKSLGNVVDPLDIINSGYGADALRMFELFIGPYDQDVIWNSKGVPGTYRFLQRVWKLYHNYLAAAELGTAASIDNQAELETRAESILHKTIKKVTTDLERLSFNTAIASLMECMNHLTKISDDLPLNSVIWRSILERLLQLLAPFAPHISEELWFALGHDASIHISGWPSWDDNLLRDELKTIVVQINGKMRSSITIQADTSMDEAIEVAMLEPTVSKYLNGKKINNTIKVDGKLINFVM